MVLSAISSENIFQQADRQEQSAFKEKSHSIHSMNKVIFSFVSVSKIKGNTVFSTGKPQ